MRKMMKKTRNPLAIVLAMMMAFSLLSVAVFAEDPPELAAYFTTVNTYARDLNASKNDYIAQAKSVAEIKAIRDEIDAARLFVASLKNEEFDGFRMGEALFYDADGGLHSHLDRVGAYNALYKFYETLNSVLNTTFTIAKNVLPAGAGVITGLTTVNYGDTPAYAVAANRGYHLVEVKVADGTSVATPLAQGTTAYTFNPVHQKQNSITATYALNWTQDQYKAFIQANGLDVNLSKEDYAQLKKAVPTPADIEQLSKDANSAYEYLLNQTDADFTNILLPLGEYGDAKRAPIASVTRAEAMTMLENFSARLNVLTKTNMTIDVEIIGSGTATTTPPYIKYLTTPTYTFAPAAGWILKQVYVKMVGAADYTAVGDALEYTFDRIYENGNKLKVEFEYNLRPITINCGMNGKVAPGTTLVTRGEDSPEFTVTANSGYRIKEILVDGAAIALTDVRTMVVSAFTNVQDAHTVTATFEPIPSPYLISQWFSDMWQAIVNAILSLFNIFRF